MITNFQTTALRLRRYAALEYVLLADLRNLMNGAFDTGTRRSVIIVLDKLLETLPREFQLKERDGYLAVVLEEYPNWNREVEKLRNQHQPLLDNLQRVRDGLALSAPARVCPRRIHQELKNWINALSAHNRHETRLVQFAVNIEVGGGD